mmetsp:Transcript_6235/g.5668  ORF Transcript_6235/g.5668 Transcript_6235/m.5668 type:complete len:234 (-) Transcript_6235:401-1102(-)
MGFKQCCTSCLIKVGKVTKRSCGSALIVFIFGFIALFVVYFQLDVHEFYQEKDDEQGLIAQYVIFYLLLANGMFNYLAAMHADPGFVDQPKLNNMLKSVANYENFNPCPSCDIKRPENVHHCSWCNKCVVNLDHHCPWINNCVGYNNFRYFALFLMYSCLLSMFLIGNTIPILIDKGAGNVRGTVLATLICSIMVFLTLLPFNLFVWDNIIKDRQFIDLLKERKKIMEQKKKI